ncbi:MAG: [citrate (pro-3S)-lyase] ligase [Anaeromyxobacteraceae bacterium]
MATPLQGDDVAQARALIEAQGLAFEPPVDDLVGVFEGDALVATGARRGEVLKMIAVAPAFQGGAVLGEVVTLLVQRALAAGVEDLFVYTRPACAGSFEALNFRLLASHGRAALLEYGNGLERWLERHRALVRPGDNGAVVVNANPFTLGHRHLVEEASRRVATLYVFVVSEDRSAFPLEARLRLVRQGTDDLPNVVVLETSRYAVSAVTFPAYFLRATDDVVAIQAELDVLLFGRRIAPAFSVRRRFFGTEPYCPTTRAYNAAMRRLLPSLGIEAVEVPRLEASAGAISASSVRAALREGDHGALAALVPATTLGFLLSDGARAVRERLSATEGRHA